MRYTERLNVSIECKPTGRHVPLRDPLRTPVRRSRLCSGGGFTLVELLIAAALTVLMAVIVLEIFRITSSMSEKAHQREDVLVNATSFFNQMSEMLANCEPVGVETARTDENVPLPVFFIEHRIEDGARFDAMAFSTRAAEGLVDELTGLPSSGAQNVFVYVAPSTNPALRELVVRRFGTREIPASVDDMSQVPTMSDRSDISVLCRFVTEFRIEYLDIEAAEKESGTGVRLKPLIAGDGSQGRSYKTAGGDRTAVRGITRWHTPATDTDGRSLHDKYDGWELTTPRALMITLELRATDSEVRERFHFVIGANSPRLIPATEPVR